MSHPSGKRPDRSQSVRMPNGIALRTQTVTHLADRGSQSPQFIVASQCWRLIEFAFTNSVDLIDEFVQRFADQLNATPINHQCRQTSNAQ